MCWIFTGCLIRVSLCQIQAMIISGVTLKVLYCSRKVSKFDLQFRYCVHLQTNTLRKGDGDLCGVMVKVQDLGIVVCEFELQSRNYVHFRNDTLEKGMNPIILPAMVSKVPLLSF